ncbi:hypothetical protein [Streptomyces sp. NPDC005281]|uniref:hypothetical protein n=1 Tax=Streptomyces sp. NPDC005281 TaxID=3155712 RepID=UPI0033A0DA29
MHRNDDSGTTPGSLSTEDLARPTDTSEEVGTPQDDTSRAPAYPGESTATPGADGLGDQAGATAAADRESARADERQGGDAFAAAAVGTREKTGAPTDATDSPPGRLPASAESASDDEVPELLTADDDRRFRNHWQAIQNQFVDDPREAVHAADALVADLMQTLATTFAQHKQDLEGQWGHDKQVDTEELRRALRRYRSFFNRLLST